MLIALAFRQPHHPRARDWAQRAIEMARHHPDPALRTMAAAGWLQYQMQQGDLSNATGVVDEMRALLRTRDVSPVMAVNASMTVAWYEALKAVPSYRDTVSQVIERAQATGIFYSARHVVLSAGLLGALSDGDLETAARWLRQLERDVHLLGPMFRFLLHWFLVWEPSSGRTSRGRARPARDAQVPCSMGSSWTRRSARLGTAHELHRMDSTERRGSTWRAGSRSRASRAAPSRVHGTSDRGALGLDGTRAAKAAGARHRDGAGTRAGLRQLAHLAAGRHGPPVRARARRGHRGGVRAWPRPAAWPRPGDSAAGGRDVALAHQDLRARTARSPPRW